jgi:hypothetical protein
MSDLEFAAWREKNEAIPKPQWRASTPCVDCPHWFAEEQWQMGTCDGTPGRPKRQGSLPWPIRSAVYKREKARAWRRRQGVVDIEERMRERVEMAARLKKEGLKNVEIAKHMGVQRAAVSGYLKRAAS